MSTLTGADHLAGAFLLWVTGDWQLGIRYGGWITHVPYNGYVGKTLLPQRHPERSRGIFLAHRYSVLCETAEKGKPFAKGARKSRVQGRFLAALEMTVGKAADSMNLRF